MISKEDAENFQKQFVGRCFATLNEQVAHKLMTEVMATGLQAVLSKISAEVLANNMGEIDVPNESVEFDFDDISLHEITEEGKNAETHETTDS